MFKTPKIALSALSIFFCSHAFAESPTNLKINSFHAEGPPGGCSNNTTHPSISSDSQNFSLTFDRFEVNFGERISYCDVYINLAVPTGWSFAIEGTSVKGFAMFNRRRTSEVLLNIGLSGISGLEIPHKIRVKDPIEFISAINEDNNPNENWSSCGGSNLSIETSLVSGALPILHQEAFSISKSEEADRGIDIKIKWRHCES